MTEIPDETLAQIRDQLQHALEALNPVDNQPAFDLVFGAYVLLQRTRPQDDQGS